MQIISVRSEEECGEDLFLDVLLMTEKWSMFRMLRCSCLPFQNGSKEYVVDVDSKLRK